MRGVFNQYLGWFGGDPVDLHPLSPVDRAVKMQALAGGADNLLTTARDGLSRGDAQWALECAQAGMRANITDQRYFNESKSLVIECLQKLGEGQISANGRNYYLTYALELDGSLVLAPSNVQKESVLRQLNGADILKMLPIRLNAEVCLDVEFKVMYSFSDIERAVVIEIRRGVALVYDVPLDTPQAEIDLTVSVLSSVFIEIACKSRNKTTAIINGDMKVVGRGMTSSLALKKFMDYFDDSDLIITAPV